MRVALRVQTKVLLFTHWICVNSKFESKNYFLKKFEICLEGINLKEYFTY